MELRQLRGWMVRLRSLFSFLEREREERELAEELESHLRLVSAERNVEPWGLILRYLKH